MRFRALLLSLVAIAGCRSSGVDRDVADFAMTQVPFDRAFVLIDTMRLGDSATAVGNPADLLPVPEGLMIADAGLANLAVFDRQSGERVRVVGRPGDGPGEFRGPTALAPGMRGSVVVMDLRRKLLSRRTAAGDLDTELHLNGRPTAMTTLPDGRLILFGRLRTSAADSVPFDAPVPIIHEIDSAGVIVGSHHVVPWPTDSWRATYANYFGTAVGSVIVAGSFHSAELHFEDLASGRSWSTLLRAPWFHEPEWPTDSRALSGESAAEERREWLARQTLVHRVTNIGKGRVVAEVDFKEVDSSAEYGYIVVDTTGRVLQSTERTPVRLLRLEADTLLGLRLNDDGSLVLERRVPNESLLIGVKRGRS
ncbi:MAG: hypothetical protein AB7L66_07650 [Gemmatimonadales bacterium]